MIYAFYRWGVGGVKTAKVLCGANSPFSKKRKIFSERKKEKRKNEF
jgi:hypothetical protein